ncbi:MAG: hypothetical protein WC499_00610 [Patescibacteria group bacterium]
MNKIIYWLPRILSIGFVVFLSLFSLDVFSEYSGWRVILPLFMHLLPSFALLILIIVAWKHERLGGFIFLIIGLLMLILSRFESMIISIPAIILGALFLSRKYLSEIKVFRKK